MTRQRQESAAQRRARELRESNEGEFGDLSVSQLKDNIVRLLKEVSDHEDSKKDAAASWGVLIKDKKGSIQYCTERIDHLRHEDAVAAHVEAAA